MAQYGMVTDVQATKQELRNLNRDYNARRTWAGMETNLALSAQAANAKLGRDYSTAMSDAYNAARLQERSIKASGILGQQGDVLLQQNRAALEEAYNTYMSNLQSGQQSIAEQYAEGITAIDDALTQEAEYQTEYFEKHYDYLEYLYNQYGLGENTLFDNTLWSKFLTDELDEKGKPVLDAKGNAVRRLKTKDELYAAGTFIEDEEGNKEWTGLFDDEGNLTIAGIDFIDQMQNANITGTSFGQYLAQTDIDFLMDQYGYTRSEAEKVAERNAELFEWSNTYNPYDYTPGDGTHKGTFKTMQGMLSTDYTYSFAERFGGLSSKEIDTLFSQFNDARDAIDKKMSKAKDKGYSITKEISTLIDSVHDMAEELGIEADLAENGINWDELKAQAVAYHAGTKSGGEMTGKWFGLFGGSAVGGAVTGLGIGAGAGTSAGPLGTVIGGSAGAIIGTIVGAIIGTVTGSIEVDKARKQNQAMAKGSQELFNELLASMSAYAANKKRQREIDFRLANS